MPLDSLLGPQLTSLIAYATAILTAFALLYGFVKIAWTKLSGRPFPDNRFTRGLDALAELGSNLVGFVNKVKRGDGAPLIPNPEVVARDATIAELRAALDRIGASLPMLAEKQGALDVSATRPSVAPSTPTPADGVDAADEDAHASIVPPPPFDPHHTMRGSVDVRSLLAVVVAVVCVAGCPLVREAAMRAAPGVPDPVECVPGVQRCDGLIPVVCSASHREWPTLPRRASGEPRTCAPGVCVVSDAGVAYCDLSAADGGP